MAFNFRPAVREQTPLIIGIAGPTKSGKTYSANRLARGLAGPKGTIAMLNAEGRRGHQYADRFQYEACDIEPPYEPARYTEALLAMKALHPAVGIIDSASHMHDGPGGLLELHDKELARLAGDATGKARERYNWTAWIEPKKQENEFIYTMLGCDFPIILCFRAKEKIKLVERMEGERKKTDVVQLGWQPIASDRVAFETIFTVMLPPHSKGVPDMALSEMREPFDAMIREGEPLDEALGERLAEWARGTPALSPAQREETIDGLCKRIESATTVEALREAFESASTVAPWATDAQAAVIKSAKNKRYRELTAASRSPHGIDPSTNERSL